jgi:hypothetical protein
MRRVYNVVLMYNNCTLHDFIAFILELTCSSTASVICTILNGKDLHVIFIFFSKHGHETQGSTKGGDFLYMRDSLAPQE